MGHKIETELDRKLVLGIFEHMTDEDDSMDDSLPDNDQSLSPGNGRNAGAYNRAKIGEAIIDESRTPKSEK